MSCVGASHTEPVPRNVWSSPSPLVIVPSRLLVDFSTENSIRPVRKGEVAVHPQHLVLHADPQHLVGRDRLLADLLGVTEYRREVSGYNRPWSPDMSRTKPVEGGSPRGRRIADADAPDIRPSGPFHEPAHRPPRGDRVLRFGRRLR
jgi:hypothetical protein